MKNFSRAISNLQNLDTLSRLKTPAHALNARAQILTSLAFVIVLSSFPQTYLGALLPLFLYPATILSLGEIPLRALVSRIAIALPFVLFVAVWNPVLEIRAVHFLGKPINAGWISGASILLRAILATSAMVLLVACTGIPRLAHALRSLKVPSTIVTLFVLIYRYLFVIVSEAERLVRAFQVRSGKQGTLSPKQLARVLGVLLARCVERSERIHAAMTARRFHAELPLVEKEQPLSLIDYAWFFAWMAFFVVCRLYPMFGFLNFGFKGILR